MKYSREYFVNKGKEGAKKRYQKKYEIIEELRRYMSKSDLDKIIHRTTEWLEMKLELIKEQNKNKPQ